MEINILSDSLLDDLSSKDSNQLMDWIELGGLNIYKCKITSNLYLVYGNFKLFEGLRKKLIDDNHYITKQDYDNLDYNLYKQSKLQDFKFALIQNKDINIL